MKEDEFKASLGIEKPMNSVERKSKMFCGCYSAQRVTAVSTFRSWKLIYDMIYSNANV